MVTHGEHGKHGTTRSTLTAEIKSLELTNQCPELIRKPSARHTMTSPPSTLDGSIQAPKPGKTPPKTLPSSGSSLPTGDREEGCPANHEVRHDPPGGRPI